MAGPTPCAWPLALLLALELRRAFGDSAQNPQVIKTIPKVGFCLVPPIEELVAESGVSEQRLKQNRQWISKRIWALSAALAIVVLAFGTWWYQRDVAVDHILTG